ncbi:phage tail tape measure protein [Chachezhania sediminis]|uniref:hypothetical protein n=1 Tax=Chachezhania sediminis TaxID=2599291 RepID=UPI00131E6754|nr:hypothetical protein [Chachezhania sediminis]
MAVEIGALRALLSLDSAAFEKGAKRAQTSMGKLERFMSKAAAKMTSVGKTMSARVTAPLVAAGGLMVRSSLRTVDAQAKFAQSLGTTTSSIQTLTRAADMAGISQGELEGSLLRMTRRISLAEQGAGAGAKAFARLGIEARNLAGLDAAERVKLIQERIAALIPAAEQAAVASQIFGDRTGLAMQRLDAATIDKANAELERFGVKVSDIDADKIEEANDAMSALGLVTTGLANQMTVALAPTLKRIAEAIANVAAWFSNLSPQMKQFIAVSVSAAAAIGPVTLGIGLMASGMATAIGAVRAMVAALFTMRGAMLATGIGALVVAAGVLANWFTKLVNKAGGFSEALSLLGDVAQETWSRIGQGGRGLYLILKGAADGIAAAFVSAFAWIAGKWDSLVNGMAAPFNRIMDGLGIDAQIGASKIGEALGGIADEWSGNAVANIAEGGALLKGAATAPMESLNALKAVMAATAEEAGGAAAATADLGEAIKDIPDLESVTGGGGGAGKAAKEAAEAAKKAMQETAAEAATVASEITTPIKDALKSGEFEFRSFADAAVSIMQRMADRMIDKAFAPIEDALANLIVGQSGKGLFSGTSFGGIGAAVSGLFSGFKGFFADGGVLGAGEWGFAGERGIEPVVGPAKVISNKDAFGGGNQMGRVDVGIDGAGNLAVLVRNIAGQVVGEASASIIQTARRGAVSDVDSAMRETRTFGGGRR